MLARMGPDGSGECQPQVPPQVYHIMSQFTQGAFLHHYGITLGFNHHHHHHPHKNIL